MLQAFVLPGGSSLAATQAGMLQALYEHGIRCSIGLTRAIARREWGPEDGRNGRLAKIADNWMSRFWCSSGRLVLALLESGRLHSPSIRSLSSPRVSPTSSGARRAAINVPATYGSGVPPASWRITRRSSGSPKMTSVDTTKPGSRIECT